MSLVEPAEQLRMTSSLDATLGFRLSRLARALRQDYARRLAPLQVSPPQSALLRAVAEVPGSSLRGVARRLASDPMAAKRLADDLERRGLLRSEPAPVGRRARRLSVTEQGRAVAEAASALAAEQQGELVRALGPASLDQLGALLGRLESRLLAEEPPTSHGRVIGAVPEAEP